MSLRKLDYDRIKRMAKEGMNFSAIARAVGCSRRSVQKIVHHGGTHLSNEYFLSKCAAAKDAPVGDNIETINREFRRALEHHHAPGSGELTIKSSPLPSRIHVPPMRSGIGSVWE